MPSPKQVYICPACQRYMPVDEFSREDTEKPVCRTPGCDREGKILSRMWMCPACHTCFAEKQLVTEHGATHHGSR